MANALSKASLLPGDIDLIKAHGTGSASNDAAEAAAMEALFGDTIPNFTILKPYLGHTLGASGILEMVVLLDSLLAGSAPATAGFRNRDPDLGCQPIEQTYLFNSGRVMLNCFGFGGNNSSTILSVGI